MKLRKFILGNYAYAETVMLLRVGKYSGTEGSSTISLFFELPLDVQIEILGWLHPIDLLRLPRIFPELLISSSTWKSSFQTHVDSALQCPKEVSFPRWASLLFDPHKCDECNIRHALPDFAKVERVCFDCQTRRYIPTLGTPIARALLSQESRLCWSRDRMDAVNKKLDRLEKEIALGKLGAQDAFDEYREELVAEANDRLLVREFAPLHSAAAESLSSAEVTLLALVYLCPKSVCAGEKRNGDENLLSQKLKEAVY
ncbi:hypothetical protein AAF712_000033 [Marasmius tenuissimus]|uniref:F-box domain-containing protein n=1 Tax=Marasmius tenuissimus TaxID=585030 RepID=A0ABR3AFV9_9AGAR